MTKLGNAFTFLGEGTAPMDSSIQDELLKRRTIVVSGPINAESANKTVMDLFFLESEDRKAPISIFINSPGGEATATMAVVDSIKFCKPPVRTCGLMEVQGSALWVLVAGTIGHRYCQPNSRLLLIAAAGDESGWEWQVQLSSLNSRLVELFREKTKLSELEAIQAVRWGRELTVPEALASGIVDAISGLERPNVKRVIH